MKSCIITTVVAKKQNKASSDTPNLNSVWFSPFFFFNTYLSKVAANMYLPFGENFTKDTGGLSSSTAKLKAVLQSAQLCCLPERISFHIHLFLIELFLFH